MIIRGDARSIPLADESVQCVVTSPPYWGLRAYAGIKDSIWRGHDAWCNHLWDDQEKGKRKDIAPSEERGECSQCGKNLVRVTEHKFYGDWRSTSRAQDLIHGNVKNRDAWSRGQYSPPQTLGWEPTCACAAPTRANLVLDPFFGSGTVGKVAERLGRRWIGLELSDQYIAIAQRRTAQTGFQF